MLIGYEVEYWDDDDDDNDESLNIGIIVGYEGEESIFWIVKKDKGLEGVDCCNVRLTAKSYKKLLRVKDKLIQKVSRADLIDLDED